MSSKPLFITVFALLALVLISRFSIADKAAAAPSEKEILNALFNNLDVPLKNGMHCDNVGIEATDRTIGDYLSGFWRFHTSKEGKNWLDVSAQIFAQDIYLAKVMIYRKDGEENWGWGVSFKLGKNKNVLRDSFTCLGAG